jgi:hypothetical protein
MIARTEQVAADVQGMVEALRELMAKATPGPWNTRDGDAGLVTYIQSGQASWIADVHSFTPGFGPSRAERLANAALIVALVNAAPALLDALESSQSPSPVSEEARATLSYAAGILAEVGKGHRRSDAEDDWLECPVCHKRVDHYGHAKTCRLRLAEAHIAGTLDRLAALSAPPPVWTPTDEQGPK